MQSPWQTDTSRNSGERDYFNEESNSHGNGWPGNIIERSTSAPPIPTEQFRLMNTGSEQFGGETVSTNCSLDGSIITSLISFSLF